MPRYYTLGARRAEAKPDTTGTNPGSWTATFTPAALGVKVDEFEIYKAVIETTQPGTGVKIKVGPYSFSVGPTGKGAEWDPNQPALVRNGQTVTVLFSQKTETTPAPIVTIWLRYEP